MIKKYSQFIKENKQVKTNEDFDQEEGLEDFGQESGSEVEDNEMFANADEEIGSNEGENLEEEEGDGYIGQRMIQDLADALDVQPEADGSVIYNGQKINFFSETEMFHIGSMKFETVDEVVNYLNNEGDRAADDEADDMKNDEILRQRELEDEDDRALLSGEGEEDLDEPSFEEIEGDLANRDLESEFESKSYKYTRKFESFRK